MGNARRPAADSPAASDREVGFAKLQGECFEYYMQTYSIVLGRHSRRSSKGPAAPPTEADDGVDVDLGALGGGMNVSRRHARIFYDFPRRRFALEVLGKNGCLVEGVHHVPGSAPVKLDSQDLLQMGEAKFYFLLPSRSVFDAGIARRAPPSSAGSRRLRLTTTRMRMNRERPWQRRSVGGRGITDQNLTGKQMINYCFSWKRKMSSHLLLLSCLISVDLRNGFL
ncbi:hypothetical protein BDA96_05G122800 [Sorghum bicolor]|uniref:FHA domain-containing protein n=1 Tax=Sorghum bicolor TaxID=4558 RepID=A0A921QY20_SORBI|nr:hypothetical protein BDA96_05G122800 [Sorghum bicolor]